MKRLSEYAASVGRKRVAQNILRLGANVADAETITIGRDVFEMDTNATSTAGNIAVNVNGNPPPNGIKFFAAVEVTELSQDRAWLARATNAVNLHWHNQNLRKKGRAANATPHRPAALTGLSLAANN